MCSYETQPSRHKDDNLSITKRNVKFRGLEVKIEILDPSCSVFKLMAVPGRTQMKLNDDYVALSCENRSKLSIEKLSI